MKFVFKTEEYNMDELHHIVVTETRKHFEAPAIDIKDHLVKVIIDPVEYYEDIEKAKEQLYKDKNNKEPIFMKDWISQIQENLSFVPEIEVHE